MVRTRSFLPYESQEEHVGSQQRRVLSARDTNNALTMGTKGHCCDQAREPMTANVVNLNRLGATSIREGHLLVCLCVSRHD